MEPAENRGALCQEVGAQTIVAKLDPLSRARIKEFSDASPFLLRMFLDQELDKPKH